MIIVYTVLQECPDICILYIFPQISTHYKEKKTDFVLLSYLGDLKTKYNLLAFQRSFYLSERQILKYKPIEKYSTTQTFKKI
jgi:hypothetical protein